jgi:hypothetical protein
VERRGFSAPGELRALPENVVFNCLGVGAGAMFADTAVVPDPSRRG